MKKKIISMAIVRVPARHIIKWLNMRYGSMSSITVIIYAIPVYTEDFNGVSVPSAFCYRYSLAAIEKDAAMPVISPARAIRRVFCNAKVRPAKAPVSSTNASFKPRTMEPT